MLERYRIHKPKLRNKVELKAVLEGIWADLPQAPIHKAILALVEEARDLCHSVNADGDHFEHQQYCSSCYSQTPSAPFRATKIIQKESQRH